MIVAFAGSRPGKLGGFQLPNPTYISVCQKLEALLRELKPEKALSGMSTGFDQYAANVCIKLGIPFGAICPFLGQEAIWPVEAQKIYRRLLAKAAEVVIVSEGGFTPAKYQIRNEYLVDKCDKLVACFDGAPSGTANCVNYAKSIDKPIIIIDSCDHKWMLDGHNAGDPICSRCLKYEGEIK